MNWALENSITHYLSPPHIKRNLTYQKKNINEYQKKKKLYFFLMTVMFESVFAYIAEAAGMYVQVHSCPINIKQEYFKAFASERI